jgi:hypothetical protein
MPRPKGSANEARRRVHGLEIVPLLFSAGARPPGGASLRLVHFNGVPLR